MISSNFVTCCMLGNFKFLWPYTFATFLINSPLERLSREFEDRQCTSILWRDMSTVIVPGVKVMDCANNAFADSVSKGDSNTINAGLRGIEGEIIKRATWKLAISISSLKMQ